MYFLGNKYNLLQLQTNKCFSIYIFLSFLATRICHSNYYNVLRDNLRERRIFRVMLQSSLPTAAGPRPPRRAVTHHRARGVVGFPHRNSRSPIFLMSEISICHESGSATFRLSVRQFPRRASPKFCVARNLARITFRRRFVSAGEKDTF